MTTLTLQQTAAYARAAGFTGDDLVDIVAVATPESSLRTDAVNASSGAVGVWQINQPVHVRDHPTWTRSWLMDPQNNAAAARVIFTQQGMKAWEAWTSGAAATYLPAARTAVAAVGGGTAAGSAPAAGTTADPASWWLPDWNFDDLTKEKSSPGIVDALTSVVTIAIHAAAWIANPANWNRLVWVIVGGGMVLIGLEKVGIPAASTLKKVASVAPKPL